MLSPIVVLAPLPPTIPPVANAPDIAPKAAITAATPAAIAAILAGNGNFAPEAVAFAIASPDAAEVFAAELVVSIVVAAVSAAAAVVVDVANKSCAIVTISVIVLYACII